MPEITARKKDPLLNSRYRVYIENFPVVGFSKISGLEESTASFNYREGDEKPRYRKVAGLTSYGNVTMERAMDPNKTLRELRKLVHDINGPNFEEGVEDPDYKLSVIIEVLDKKRSVAKRFKLHSAWCNMRGIGDLDANADADPLTEKIEWTHEGLEELDI